MCPPADQPLAPNTSFIKSFLLASLELFDLEPHGAEYTIGLLPQGPLRWASTFIWDRVLMTTQG